MQIARHQRRRLLLRGMEQREQVEIAHNAKAAQSELGERSRASLEFTDSDPLLYTSPKDHHHISDSQRYHEDINRWLTKHRNDPAVKVRLK
jgi:hypothetical protein